MSTETKTVAIKPIDEVRSALTKMQSQFASVLPSHITAERFVRVAMTAIQMNPYLLNLNRQSLYSACMLAAQDGLLPDGREGAILPYRDAVKWSPMVGGICKKARNSGEILTLDAQVVYSKDEYDSWTDETGPHFKHRRARGDRGEPITTYAYAVTKDNACFFEEIDEEQMAEIEKASPAKNSPWKGSFRDEMKRKSAIRRLAKYRLPASTDLEEIIRRDDDMYELGPNDAPSEPQSKPSRLGKIVESATDPQHVVPEQPIENAAPVETLVDTEKPTREQIVMAIGRHASKLGMDKDKLKARAQKSFGKDVLKLTHEELELFEEVLASEVQNAG